MLRALTRYPMDRRKFDDAIAEVAAGGWFSLHDDVIYDSIAPPSLTVAVFNVVVGHSYVTVPMTKEGL